MPGTDAAPALEEARATLRRATADLLAVPDATLERPWQWPGHGEADVRYGLYRVLEVLEAAEGRLAGLGGVPTAAEAAIAPTTAAAWELDGLLAGLAAADLDADPGGGEWTVRRTLAHMIFVQWAYAGTTAWWREQRRAIDDPALPRQAPDALDASLGPEERAADGSLAEIRRRLRTAVDEAGAGLASLSPDELALGARWSGFAVPIGFRLGRWSSHLREHTVQVDKTLALIGRPPSEVERIVRLVTAAWGRLEARTWPGLPAPDALAIVDDAAGRAAETAAAVRRTATETATATAAGAEAGAEAGAT